jgi:tripartite-type tricarboxylate transporter receptor subunit TctC
VCPRWDAAKAYVSWLSKKTGKTYRLLAEAEWEYAARARTRPGSYPRYFFGDNEDDMCRYGNGADQTAKKKNAAEKDWTFFHCSDGYAYTSPVGSFLPNGFGLYDMHGNAQQWLSERLSQSFVIDNQPGAAGNIATEAVVRASPNAYVTLYVTAGNAINATLYEKLNFNFINDIAPVAFIQRVPLVMVVTPSLPSQTVPQFVDYAKSNPGKISFGSTGIGTASHLAGELFKFMTGINMVHVPYRGGGGPLFTDLLSGQVQVTFLEMATTIAYIRSGKLRALAVTSARHLDALPDVPAVGEFFPGYEASAWDALGAPKNTPKAIIGQLNRETNAGLADAKLSARFREFGGEPAIMSPTEFGQFIASETEKWGQVIKFAGLKAE